MNIAKNIKYGLELAVEVDGFCAVLALLTDHTFLEAVEKIVFFKFLHQDRNRRLNAGVVK